MNPTAAFCKSFHREKYPVIIYYFVQHGHTLMLTTNIQRILCVAYFQNGSRSIEIWTFSIHDNKWMMVLQMQKLCKLATRCEYWIFFGLSSCFSVFMSVYFLEEIYLWTNMWVYRKRGSSLSVACYRYDSFYVSKSELVILNFKLTRVVKVEFFRY